MQAVQSFLSSNLDFSFLNIHLSANFIRASSIIALVFLLIVSLASFRKRMIGWSAKGALFGLFFGFLFALILEGFLIIGGKTAITEVIGWKNAPAPIQLALESGRGQLIKVLGVGTEIPSSYAKSSPTVDDAVNVIQGLTPSQKKQLKNLICTP